MLRRLLSLSILCASVMFAGSPALVCAQPMPAQHCCPSAPGAPCPDQFPHAPQGLPTKLACCAAGVADTTAVTASAVILKIEKHAEGAGPPAAISSYLVPIIADLRWPASRQIALASRSISYSGLYLSTGRLRL
jgi:hypothetical protein